MSNTAARRNRVIDLIKGIAIILVVFGHSIEFGSGAQYNADGLNWINPIYKFIYGCHMPLLMIISGYLFYGSICKYNSKELVFKKIKSRLLTTLLLGER